MARSECRGCGEVFNSVGAFDAHRVGSFGGPIYGISKSGKQGAVVGREKPARRCLTPEEMEAKGMLKNERGLWIEKEYTGPASFKKAKSSEESEDEA